MTDAAAFLLSAAMHAIKVAGPALAGIAALVAVAAVGLVACAVTLEAGED